MITFARLVMSVAIFRLVDVGGLWLITSVLFLVAVLSDALDGYLARAYNWKSVLGRILDPFADKIIICGTLVFLVKWPESGVCPWIATAVVGRELFVSAIRGIVEGQGIDFSARLSGKLKMVLQSIAVLLALLSLDDRLSAFHWFTTTRDYTLYVAVLVTLYSAGEYVWALFRSNRSAHVSDSRN